MSHAYSVDDLNMKACLFYSIKPLCKHIFISLIVLLLVRPTILETWLSEPLGPGVVHKSEKSRNCALAQRTSIKSQFPNRTFTILIEQSFLENLDN